MTARMVAMKTQILVLRGPVDQDSSSVPMDAVCHQAMCVMPKMTVGMDLMSLLKHAVSLDITSQQFK